MKKPFSLLLSCLFFLSVYSQKTIFFKDSLDHKFDLSDWVLKAHGFIPVPMLITEPAVGGFGGALFGVFVDPNPPYLDTISGSVVKTQVKPNIYGAGGAYTANGTWVAGGMAIGTIRKWRTSYRLVSCYADVNLEFYRDFPDLGEQSFEFNIKTIPVSGQLLKQLGHSSWFAGVDYLFLQTELRNPNSLFNSPKEISSLVSRLGFSLDYDTRDNIFTPNKGFKWNTLFGVSDEVIGSDYNYSLLNTAAFAYLPMTKKLVAGFRAEYQQVFGDTPFYLLPFVNMRGIPIMRYQGEIVPLVETEWRWDFTSRYSLVGFAGTSKALMTEENFSDAPWHSSAGAGLRYLLARKLKLRMGVDVARGPEDWAYYIVFGTNWLR